MRSLLLGTIICLKSSDHVKCQRIYYHTYQKSCITGSPSAPPTNPNCFFMAIASGIDSRKLFSERCLRGNVSCPNLLRLFCRKAAAFLVAFRRIVPGGMFRSLTRSLRRKNKNAVVNHLIRSHCKPVALGQSPPDVRILKQGHQTYEREPRRVKNDWHNIFIGLGRYLPNLKNRGVPYHTIHFTIPR